MSPPTVAISGSGIAAACCDQLLRRAGLHTHWTGSPGTAVPAIMLSDPARALVRDCLSRPGLFAGNPRIHRRIVAWGGQEPASLPHAAIMLGRGDLEFPSDGTEDMQRGETFGIHAGRQFPEQPMLRFGDRFGETRAVRLLLEEDADSCWVESVEDGWLFMIPASGGNGWLLSVGDRCDTLLDQARYLHKRIAINEDAGACFDTSPRTLARMHGSDWLACGSGAMAFDPICGDGTALAVRQAILASAIAVALAEGESAGQLLEHYQAMMTAAMRRHLRLCSEFYATGGTGLWWQAQQQAISEGFAACTARLEREPPPRFALEGFRLVRRDLAA